MRVLLALLFVWRCSLALPAHAADAASAEDAVRDYMLCARRMAVRLEPSGETAEAIGRAATAYCSAEGAAAANYAFQHPERGLTPVKLGDDARYFAEAQAVAARLCRKTGDCGLNSVP